jgi:hypothetical protein
MPDKWDKVHEEFEVGDILCHHGVSWNFLGHSGLIVDPSRDPGLENKNVIEVGRSGVVMRPRTAFATPAYVFRPKDMTEQDKQLLSNTALKMLLAKPVYRNSTAVKGLMSESFGQKAQADIAKYRGRENACPKKMVCSEFVTLCFQLAFFGVEGKAPFVIRKHAKHITPTNLRKYLQQSPAFTHIANYSK